MKAVLGERGRVTIPKSVRDRLGLRPGQRLDVVEQDGRVVMTKDLSDDPVARLYGTLRIGGVDDTDALIEAMRGVADLPPGER
jgi:antitoxin PrlF